MKASWAPHPLFDLRHPSSRLYLHGQTDQSECTRGPVRKSAAMTGIINAVITSIGIAVRTSISSTASLLVLNQPRRGSQTCVLGRRGEIVIRIGGIRTTSSSLRKAFFGLSGAAKYPRTPSAMIAAHNPNNSVSATGCPIKRSLAASANPPCGKIAAKTAKNARATILTSQPLCLWH